MDFNDTIQIDIKTSKIPSTIQKLSGPFILMKGLFYAMLSLSLVVALDAIGIIDKAVTGTSNNLK